MARDLSSPEAVTGGHPDPVGGEIEDRRPAATPGRATFTASAPA
jgi:hypothetical protein